MGILDMFKREKKVKTVVPETPIDNSAEFKRQPEVKKVPQNGDYLKIENDGLKLESIQAPYINGDLEVVRDDSNNNELYTPKGMAKWARE
jgi:hypothetical protein